MEDEDLDLEAKLLLNTDNYKKGLKETETETEKTTNKIMGIMKKAGSAFVAAFAFDKIKDFFISANKEFEESERNVNSLNQALKTTGQYSENYSNKLQDQASALQKLTGIEDDEIITGQRLLLTFTNIGQNALPEATKAALDMSAAMGQDMQSSAIQLGKALDNPVEGLTALGRVGIKFTQTQENMIKNFMQQGDIMSAQNIILKEVEARFGDMAETMKTKSSDATNAWKEFLEAVGQKTKPAFDKALEGLAAFFSGAAKIVRKGGNETTEDLKEQREKLLNEWKKQQELINKTILEPEKSSQEYKNMLYRQQEDILKRIDILNERLEKKDVNKKDSKKTVVKTDEQIAAEKKASEERIKIEEGIKNRTNELIQESNEQELKNDEEKYNNKVKNYSDIVEAHNDYLKAMNEGQENALKKEAETEDKRLSVLDDIDKRTEERDKKIKKIEDTKAKQEKEKRDAEKKDIVKKSENEILIDNLRLNSKKELYDTSETMMQDWITGQWAGLDEYAKILTEDLQMQSAKIAAEAGLKAVLFTAEGFAAAALGQEKRSISAFAAAGEFALTAAIAGTTSFALGSISRSVGGNENNTEEETTTSNITEKIVESSTKKEAETIYITNNDYVKLVRNNQFPAIQKVLDSGKKLQVGG